MRVLVTGGAGYIGSVAVELLVAAGHAVAVLDDLSRGHSAAIEPGAEVFIADLRDRTAIEQAARLFRPEVVMHFAAASIVPESMIEPQRYFETNVVGTANLLAACRASGIERFVFSSTAATYGIPDRIPIDEDAPTAPINVYGRSKLMVEQMLAAWEQAYGFRYVAFRYFNVAGATQRHGEDHEPETHVIPVALQTLLGKRASFGIYGTDYPTPDGTAIRDYIHVEDLARAHILALDALASSSPGPINLGSRTGFSVKEIVAAVERMTGRALPVEHQPRRAGDPPSLVADSARAEAVLGWRPERGSLDEMIGSAWDWMQRHPDGYGR